MPVVTMNLNLDRRGLGGLHLARAEASTERRYCLLAGRVAEGWARQGAMGGSAHILTSLVPIPVDERLDVFVYDALHGCDIRLAAAADKHNRDHH
jgi:hypothetical protein